MKRFLLPVGMIAGLSLAMWSCVDKLAYEPTYAIPLVDGSLTIGEVVGARPSEIDSLPVGDRVMFQLVYLDTNIPSQDYIAIDNAPPSGLVLGESNTFLRMTGKSETGQFQFTNPKVDFIFTNSGEGVFDLFIENTYTKNVGFDEPGPQFEFDIREMIEPAGNPEGWRIPAAKDTIHSVTNENAIDASNGQPGALTTVFTPAPKNLYYTPRIVKVSGSGSGTLDIVTRVSLPMQGYATGSRQDTLPYAIEDEAVREAFQENLEFAIIRLSFVNSLPAEVELVGSIVDTNRTDPSGGPLKLADLILTEQDGNLLSNNIIIEGAPIDANGVTTPTRSVIDININDDASDPSSNLKASILEGNAILLDYVISTTDYTNSNEVIFYSDQQLDINMGLKFKVAVEQDRQELLDSLGI